MVFKHIFSLEYTLSRLGFENLYVPGGRAVSVIARFTEEMDVVGATGLLVITERRTKKR